ADLPKAADILNATPGVEEVFDSPTAARLFHLYPQRIGDLFVLGAKDTAFGDLTQARELAKVRSHGSRHEARVPLVVYGRKVDIRDYEYNLDLTRNLLSGGGAAFRAATSAADVACSGRSAVPIRLAFQRS